MGGQDQGAALICSQQSPDERIAGHWAGEHVANCVKKHEGGGCGLGQHLKGVLERSR